MNHLKATATLLIALMTCLTTAQASAHCPDGGRCFTESEAADRLEEECSEARSKYKACRSELAKCENMEALKNKCKGNLEESRRDSRLKAKTIKAQDRKLENAYQAGDVFNWTVGGFVFGVGAGGAAVLLLK